MSTVTGWDAAFCPDPVPAGHAYAKVYIGGSSAYHVWTADERAKVHGMRVMPIWVPTPGVDNPRQVAMQAADALKAIGVTPFQTPYRALMWDLETGREPDPGWLTVAADKLNSLGYDNLVYGSVSASGLFSYPSRLGYVVADPTGKPHMYDHADVAETQYAQNVTVPGGQVDLDLLNESILAHLGEIK
jgi:hypothetical protein